VSAERTIVAWGGMTEEHGDAMEAYILGLTGKARPRICFLPTATGDSAERTLRFYASFGDKADATHLALFDRTVDDLRALLLAQDVIQVGGGNTANVLAVWRVQGVDRILREAWKAGIVLTGVSAGAICWFEACVTDSFGGTDALRDGLGFLAGSMCPHYDSEPNRRPVYRRLVSDGFPAGYAAEDDVALHFAGTELHAVVSPREDGRAFRVEPDGEAALGVTLIR
jgi:peptidase E